VKKLVPWLGGKRALARRIAENLPTHTCYVEPFAGGASVFFVKSKSRVEVLNDKHLGLVNLFRVVQRHPDAFLAELGLVVSSREWYEACWAQPGLTDVERAARFYYRVKHTFGGKPEERSFGYGTTTTSGINPATLEADIRAIHGRLHRVTLECLDFGEVIRRYDRPHTLFYCDPPYYGLTGYGPSLPFGREDHERLAGLLKDIRGRFLLSINDHPFIRDLYAWARIEATRVRYTISRTKTGRASRELLIRNFERSGRTEGRRR